MPLTSKGFERLTYDEIVNKKIQKAKELFGEDIDTSELTPLGKFIRINAFDLAEAEEEAEYIYYSIFPNTASGVSLDRLCTFVGISRNPATSAKGKWHRRLHSTCRLSCRYYIRYKLLQYCRCRDC